MPKRNLGNRMEIPALGHGRLNMSDGPNLNVDTQLFHSLQSDKENLQCAIDVMTSSRVWPRLCSTA